MPRGNLGYLYLSVSFGSFFLIKCWFLKRIVAPALEVGAALLRLLGGARVQAIGVSTMKT